MPLSLRARYGLPALNEIISGLVAPSAAADPIAFSRHRRFIAAHLFAGLAALAAFPPYIALRGGLTIVEALVFALLLAPMVLAVFLSRTARFEEAQILSSSLLGCAVALIAAITGGLESMALAWMVIVPLEALGAGSRRAAGYATTVAVGAIALVGWLDFAGLLPEPTGLGGAPLVHAIGLAGAVAYAGVLGFSLLGVHSTGVALIRSGEARYAVLAETMNDLFTRHVASGAVIYASPAAESMLGVKADALSGQGLFDRVHVTDRLAYLSALSRAFIDSEEGTVEFRARHGEGPGARMVWLEMRCRPFDDGGRQVIAVTRDISDRKAHEEAIEAARNEAEQANIAKGRFLATMSHELRTPLNAVIGFSELLLNEKELRIQQARRLEYAKLIHESGNHLLAVVNGILDMSKIENGNFPMQAEPFDLGELVEGCRSMMALKAEAAGVELRTEVAPVLPELVADKRACRQIYINLLSNAVKFTRSGGSVTIGARRHGDGVALFVADTGIGVGQDDLGRLGEPFFQARSAYDRPFDGTGLGLSVVKGLAAMHGGRMEIDSRVGQGTMVQVILPRDCEDLAARAAIMPSNVEQLAPALARPSEIHPMTRHVPEKKIA